MSAGPAARWGFFTSENAVQKITLEIAQNRRYNSSVGGGYHGR